MYQVLWTGDNDMMKTDWFASATASFGYWSTQDNSTPLQPFAIRSSRTNLHHARKSDFFFQTNTSLGKVVHAVFILGLQHNPNKASLGWHFCLFMISVFLSRVEEAELVKTAGIKTGQDPELVTCKLAGSTE